MRRLALLAIVAIALAPGTWLRTDTMTRDYDAPITLTPIATRSGISGPLRITGAWDITTSNDHFGGYSALVLLPKGSLLAGSDRGRMMEVNLAGGEPVAAGARLDYWPEVGAGKKSADLEALTRNPETSTIWAAFENRNLIERIDADGTITRRSPPEMAGWSGNSGAETMVRLNDGRFLVLAEGTDRSGLSGRPGVLFDGDPTQEGKSTEFRFASASGFSPVDATLLPDGDVLILLRRVEYSIPATFKVMLMRADPSEIVAGESWTGGVIASLGSAYWGENFEGLEFVPDLAQPEQPEAGSLYLIADDNLSIFQRSLMLRLAWPPDEPGEDAGRPNTGESPPGEVQPGEAPASENIAGK